MPAGRNKAVAKYSVTKIDSDGNLEEVSAEAKPHTWLVKKITQPPLPSAVLSVFLT